MKNSLQTKIKKSRKEKDDVYARTYKGRYRELRNSSKKRKIKLGITYEEYVQLVAGATCFYCAEPIINTTGYSLDRLNNSKGYLLNNVVPCCRSCNEAKGRSFTFEEFIYITQCIKLFRAKNS